MTSDVLPAGTIEAAARAIGAWNVRDAPGLRCVEQDPAGHPCGRLLVPVEGSAP